MTDILRRAWRQTDISTPSSTFPQEAVAAVGDQPFSISHDAALERLVVSALVAFATALADRLDAERAGGSDTSVLAPSADGDEPSPAFGAGVFMPV